jgi:predicted peptidase
MLAARNPSYFAAMIPMCGGGSTVYAKLLSHMPIWFAHAVNDNVISVNETDALVKALKDEGGQDIQYSRYEESNDASAQAWMIGHNVWDTAYRDRVLWNWLFSKSL